MTRPAGTTIVLLGTAGGPPAWPGTDRAGCSTALVVDESVYLVDLGEGWRLRLREAGLTKPTYPHALESIAAVFLTHLHSDHVIGFPDLAVLGINDGLSGRETALPVIGPGAVVTREGHVVPGTSALAGRIYDAFSVDLRDRERNNHTPPPSRVVDVREIALPVESIEPPGHASVPEVEPFPVYEDELVRVTATLANHPPMFPSFAFRFETAAGTVVFSGDTSPHPNIDRLAEGADVLVHEAVDHDWIGTILPGRDDPEATSLRAHLARAHTTAGQAADLANAVGVHTLVLHHLVPAYLSTDQWERAARAFEGRLVVGQDLDVVPVSSPLEARPLDRSR